MVCFHGRRRRDSRLDRVSMVYLRGNLLAVLLLVVVRVLACPSAHQHTRVIYALRRADIGLWLSAAPAMDQVRRLFFQ